MLVVFGIFAAGIVNALDRQIPHRLIAGLCFIAAALAVIFALLDWRNRELVWLGEDVLMHLEREAIFGKDLFRRIATRYEKTARAYLSMLCIAAARLWIKTVNTA